MPSIHRLPLGQSADHFQAHPARCWGLRFRQRLRISMPNGRFAYAHLLNTHLTPCGAFSSIAHHHTFWMQQHRGGLRPTSASRPREAFSHLQSGTESALARVLVRVATNTLLLDISKGLVDVTGSSSLPSWPMSSTERRHRFAPPPLQRVQRSYRWLRR
jgi:hypothetical protein